MLYWDFFLFNHPLHDIFWYFIIRFLQINKYHMQVFLLFSIFLYKLSYQEDHPYGAFQKYKIKVIFKNHYQFY
jgi:hypothetical protein